MKPPLALKAGTDIIPFLRVERIEIGSIEHAHAIIVTDYGNFDAYGFDAIEAVMALKPSAFEGRRLKWKKGAWAFHNMLGHPIMQILAWMGCTRLAIRVHDATTPKPINWKQ